MANLGSDNTPVEGESFGLPSGFSIDEDSGNLAIRDTNGNVVAKWDEGNAQWDFANNTLNNVDALNSNSVSTGALAIGGTLYEEDDNSPIDVTNEASHTYSVAGDFHEIILIADPTLIGFNELQVNGITSDYTGLSNGGAEATSLSEWAIPFDFQRSYLTMRDANNRIRFGCDLTDAVGSDTFIAGDAGANTGNTINQFTLSDSDSTARDSKVRVYGRSI